VADAISEGERLRRVELHEEEVPVANLAALTANINRNADDRKEPYRLEDFAFYGEREEATRVGSAAGAAFKAAGVAGLLPPWALFCWEAVTAGVQDPPPGASQEPPAVAFGDGVVVAAPEEVGGTLRGLLVARKEASGKAVEIRTPAGQTYRIRVPEFPDFVIARDGEPLEILAARRQRRRPAAAPGPTNT